MIFVTVGTHEQAFNRLIKEIDELKRDGIIEDDVFIQTGFSTYEPQYCEYQSMIGYDEMVDRVMNARIVITHGGPASFLLPIQNHKIPIVVPRQKDYDEHINNHQVEFVEFLSHRQGNLIPIYDIKDLKDKICHYDQIIETIDLSVASHTDEFNKEFEKIVDQLMS